jgi:hypothetical protein
LILWIFPSAVRKRFSLDFFPTDLPTTSRGFDTMVVFVYQMLHIVAITKTITSESLSERFDRRVIRYQRVPRPMVNLNTPMAFLKTPCVNLWDLTSTTGTHSFYVELCPTP